MKKERFLNIWQDLEEFDRLRDAFLQWEHYPLYCRQVRQLKEDVLYQSHMHGVGHIHRVLLLGALLCMKQELCPEDVRLVLLACAYHDTGRVDDTLDDAHGARSAEKAEKITACTGEELLILQAAMTAHSVSDARLEQIICGYAPRDAARAKRIAAVLKDADGLDRVRIRDLDVRYLRSDAARQLVEFSNALYRAYSKGEA